MDIPWNFAIKTIFSYGGYDTSYYIKWNYISMHIFFSLLKRPLLAFFKNSAGLLVMYYSSFCVFEKNVLHSYLQD